jgi:hypothetical protein
MVQKNKINLFIDDKDECLEPMIKLKYKMDLLWFGPRKRDVARANQEKVKFYTVVKNWDGVLKFDSKL